MLLAEIVVAAGSVLLIAWALAFVKLTGPQDADARYRGRHRNA